MKQYIIAFIILVGSGLCFGQQIEQAEYFIGDDPGFGLAIQIPVSSLGDDLTLGFSADVQALSEGFHFIHVRACDDLGKWSHPVQRMFYVFKPQSDSDIEIISLEYFIDTDPGFGLATFADVSSTGNTLALNFTADFQTLSEGFHFLSIRTRDKLGKWSHPVQRIFYVFKSISDIDKEIAGLEYFIDTDPGFGNGTAVNMESTGNDLTINFVADIKSLTSDDHVLYVRCKDAINRWGPIYSQGFSVIITNVGETEIIPWYKLYPNPSNGNFYLEFLEELNSSIKITIKDLSGRTVYLKEHKNSSNSLNINLPAGMYLLNLELKNKNFTQKIVIN